MSYQAVRWVLDNSLTEGSARLVMLVIAEHADEHGRNAHPSITTIAREAKLTRRQVERVIRTDPGDDPDRDQRGEPIKLGELTVERQKVPMKIRRSDGGERIYRTHRYSLPRMPRPDIVTGRQADAPTYGDYDPTSAHHDPTSGSEEPPLEPPSKPSSLAPASPSPGEVVEGEIVENDNLMEALEEVFGKAPPDKRLRGSWNVARRRLAEQGATADQIREAVPTVRRLPKHNWMAATPPALAKYWGQISSGKIWELVDWKDQAIIGAYQQSQSATVHDTEQERRRQEHRAGIHDKSPPFAGCLDCQEASHA
jgi:Helix-turn-helix domain